MTPSPRVLVKTQDLFFRAKVEDFVRRAGGVLATAEPFDAAVMEIDRAATDDVQRMTASGVSVLVFGPHVDGAALRDLRQAGATAVPNSKLPEAVADLLRYFPQESDTPGDT